MKEIEEERKYFHYEPPQKRQEPERYRPLSQQPQNQLFEKNSQKTKQIRELSRNIPPSYPTISNKVLKEQKNGLQKEKKERKSNTRDA